MAVVLTEITTHYKQVLQSVYRRDWDFSPVTRGRRILISQLVQIIYLPRTSAVSPVTRHIRQHRMLLLMMTELTVSSSALITHCRKLTSIPHLPARLFPIGT